jgi:hypothetical protein
MELRDGIAHSDVLSQHVPVGHAPAKGVLGGVIEAAARDHLTRVLEGDLIEVGISPQPTAGLAACGIDAVLE